MLNKSEIKGVIVSEEDYEKLKNVDAIMRAKVIYQEQSPFSNTGWFWCYSGEDKSAHKIQELLSLTDRQKIKIQRLENELHIVKTGRHWWEERPTRKRIAELFGFVKRRRIAREMFELSVKMQKDQYPNATNDFHTWETLDKQAKNRFKAMAKLAMSFK